MIESKSTLLRCLLIFVDPGVCEPLVQVISRDCRWTEELLANFPRSFDGDLIGGGALVLGVHDIEFPDAECGVDRFPLSCD